MKAWAYCYRPLTVQVQVRPDAAGKCRADISLQPAPTATLTGTVTDLKGRKLAGARLWLAGTERRAVSNSRGEFQIQRVQAGRSHVLWAWHSNSLPATVNVPPIAANTSRSITVRLPRVSIRTKSIAFHGVGWAIFEEWPGINLGLASTSSFKVKVTIGHFHMTMACSYYTIQGQEGTYIGDVVIASRGGPFFKSYVGSSWSPASVLCGQIEEIAEGTWLGKAAEAYGYIVEVASAVQDAINAAKSDVDPHMLHDGTVIGTYTTHTGAKLDEVSFIDYLPGASQDIGTRVSGGLTVIMAKELVLTDGHKTRRFDQVWCSPRMAIYRVNEKFDVSKLEIRLYVWLLDRELLPGMLGNNSRNVLRWKPWHHNWLRMHRWHPSP